MYKLNAGDSIKAEELNENFDELESKIEDVEEKIGTSSNVLWGGTSTTEGNAFKLTIPGIEEYKAGTIIIFNPHTDSSSSLYRIKINNLNAISIGMLDIDSYRSSTVIRNEIKQNQTCVLVCDGYSINLVNLFYPRFKEIINERINAHQIESGYTQTITHQLQKRPRVIKVKAIAPIISVAQYKVSDGVYQNPPYFYGAFAVGTASTYQHSHLVYLGEYSGDMIYGKIGNIDDEEIEIKWTKQGNGLDADLLIELET